MSGRVVSRYLFRCGLWTALLGLSELDGISAEPAIPPQADVSADREAALNAKAETALDKRGDWDFVDTPLGTLATHLSDVAAVPVLLDRKALADSGVEAGTPLTMSLKGIRLRSLLAHLVRPLGLAWTVSDGAVLITTPEASEERRSIGIHPVRELVQSTAATDESDYDYETLIEVVTSVIAPDSWDHVGGPGSIECIHGTLVISQTYDGQHQVRGLLESLRRLAELRRQQPNAAVAPIRVEPNADNARVREALERPITLDFVDTPLRDVVAFLSDNCRMPVLLDAKGLEDSGVSSEATVTISVKETPLRLALRRLLGELELTCLVQDEALVLTTPEESEARQLVVCYPVFDLLPSPRECEWLSDDGQGYDALIQTMTSTILPDSWDAVGGASSVAALPTVASLVIRHTEAGHDQIGGLLGALRAVRPTPDTSQKPGTTPEAQHGLRLEVYRLSPGATMANPPVTPDQIAKLIRRIIEPESWIRDQNVVLECVGNQLVVRHTPRVHQTIGRFLDHLGVRESIGGGGMGGMGGGSFGPGGMAPPPNSPQP